jgi:hypothetical protein
MNRPLIFLDTETTSLDRRTRRIWDLAYIRRFPDHDSETQAFVEVSLKHADPNSLKIGGYYKRHPTPYGDSRRNVGPLLSEGRAARLVASEFRDALLVGAVPSFDEETLADLLFRHGLQSTWHYHFVDVETLAAGRWGLQPPWDFDAVLARAGLKYDEAERHTALGDARMVRDLYDAIMAPTRSGAQDGATENRSTTQLGGRQRPERLDPAIPNPQVRDRLSSGTGTVHP